jgi:hypothetical protein
MKNEEFLCAFIRDNFCTNCLTKTLLGSGKNLHYSRNVDKLINQPEEILFQVNVLLYINRIYGSVEHKVDISAVDYFVD